MSEQHLKQLLEEHAIFSVLEPAEMDALVAAMQMQSFGMGESIMQQGEPGDRAYLLYSGRVRLVRQIDESNHVTLGVLTRGDLFGERAVFEDETRTETARASEDVVVFSIHRDAILEVVGRRPELKRYFARFIEDRAIVRFLKLTTFLGVLPPRQIMELLDQLEEVTFEADEQVFAQGDPADAMYIVRQGEFRVVQTDDDGKEQVLAFPQEGDYFGELALIEDAPRAASVVAARGSQCFRLTRERLDQLLKNSPKVAKSLREGIASYKAGAELQERFGSVDVPAAREKSVDEQADMASKPQAKVPAAPRWKRGLLRKYPFVRQLDETDCGAACLAMVSRWYGVRLSVGRLRDRINVGREGASMYSLAQGAEKMGYTTRALRTDFGHLKGLDLPAIAFWKGYHFVVVYKVTDTQVVIGDPAKGLVTMPRAEFEKGWANRLLLLTPDLEELSEDEQKSTLRRFLPMVGPFKFLLLEIFLASLALNILGLAMPVFTQTIVDKVLVHQNVSLLNVMLGGMVIVAVFQVLTMVLRQYLLIHVSTKLNLKMTAQLFAQVLRLPMRYFHTRKIGDILTRFADNANVREILTGATISTLLDVLMVIVYLGLMFYYNVTLATVTVLFVPVFLAITLFFTPILKRNNQEYFEQTAIAQSKLIESLKSVATIKTAAAELYTRWAYEDLIVRTSNTAFRGARFEMVMGGLSTTVQLASSTVVLWFGAHLVLEQQMTVGELMAFQVLAGMVMAPILGVVGMYQRLQDAFLSLERLRDIYDADAEQPREAHRIAVPALKGEIKLENLTFRYNEGDANIVNGITLEIQPGQTIAIVGRSGAGKTTLASLIQGFYPPSSGRILIDGIDVTQADLPSLRRQIGVVLQETAIFSGTIRDNIATANPDASMERITEVAKLANAHEFIMQFPLGYETVVGEVGINLSGGQRQRVAIARALLNDPRILVFDEATSAVDSESEKAIQKNLASILKNRTAIVIAHRLSTIRNADQIVVLDRGVLVERGSHQELMDRKGLYYYLCSQQLNL